MNAKHTPGPWRVRQGGELGNDPQAYDVYAGEVPIARGYWGGKADITLCSAAPEMLEALEDYVKHTTQYINGYTAELPNATKARAAIAKAKGEQ